MKDFEIPKSPSLVLLFLITSLTNFMAVFYTSALPALMKYFKITNGYVESSIYFYLISAAIGCLIYGPISNRFGRKPALYVGIGVAILGSFLCIGSAVIHSFVLFDVGRILQGLGAAVGLQVGFTIIGDVYRPPKSIKITSYVSLAASVGPTIGIAIGGVLTSWFGWQGCFYFISIYLISLLILTIYALPETIAIKHHDCLKMKNFFYNYYIKFKKIRVLLSGLIIGVVGAFIYLFSVEAPFIGINFLKFSLEEYGLWNLIPTIFIAMGCLLTAFLTKYLQPLSIVLIGVWILVGFAIMIFLFFIGGYVNAVTLFLPFSCSLIGVSFIQINATGLILHHSVNKSLSSSAVQCINLIISALVVILISFTKSQNLLMLPIVFVLLGGLTCLLYFGLNNSYKTSM